MSSVYRILLLSTPVAPLGSGLGGGVELIVKNLSQVLGERGHYLTVVAPENSVLESCDRLIQLPGNLQPTAHTSQRQTPVVLPEPSVLSRMWDYARQVQHEYDVILHFAYDWLPFYLTPFFRTPIAHSVSMGSLMDAMDTIIGQVVQAFPGTVAVCTRAQAETLPFSDQYRLIANSIDLNLYEYCETPTAGLAWIGRISPEKGLEDAIAAAQASQIPLQILGKVEDPDYWQRVQAMYPDAPFDYLGFLPTAELQATLRRCRALLMTHKWVEAFGNVAIEALACGVPVIAYRRGGPTEIVRSGETGWLVEPDSVPGLVAAIARINELERAACRRQVEAEYSLEMMALRYEHWFRDILQAPKALV